MPSLNRAQRAKVKKCEAKAQNASARNASQADQPRQLPERVFKASITKVEGPLPKYEAQEDEIKEFDGKTLDYPEGMAVYTTVPGFAGSLEAYPDNWAECLFIGPRPKKLIVAQEGFPQSLPRPISPSHRIGSAPGMGTGMFATRAIQSMELIHSERPLVVVPAAFVSGYVKDILKYTDGEIARIMGAEWEKRLQVLFKRMLPENQKSFMDLADAHSEHGNGPIGGRIRTNGFEIVELRDRKRPGTEGAYSGVCNELSRMNHSCVPNAYTTFDLKSFSFQLWARREIKEGEQITVSYTSIMAPYEERREELICYGFECKCESCLDSTNSDEMRRRIVEAANGVQPILDLWYKDDTVSHFAVLHYCLSWIKVMLDMGIPYVFPFEVFVKALYECAVAAGDERGAHSFGLLWANCQCIDMHAVEIQPFIAKYSDPEYCRSDPRWATRLKPHVDCTDSALLDRITDFPLPPPVD